MKKYFDELFLKLDNIIIILNNNFIFNFIDHIFYINLEHRTDRKNLAENEIRKIDKNLNRTTRLNAYDAIKLKICPKVACAKSHLECLKIAKKNKYKRFMIFEDDFYFNISIHKLYQHLNDFFNYIKNHFYFFMLGCYDGFDYIYINDNINKVIKTYSCTGYIVNSLILDDWINLSEKNLIKNFEPVDALWQKFQGKNGKSYTCNTNQYRLIKQRSGYSDIAKRYRKITW